MASVTKSLGGLTPCLSREHSGQCEHTHILGLMGSWRFLGVSPAFLPWRIKAGLEFACGISTEVKSDPVSPGDFPLCKAGEGGFGGLGGSESVVHPACSFPRRSKQLLGREKSHLQMWIRHTVQMHGLPRDEVAGIQSLAKSVSTLGTTTFCQPQSPESIGETVVLRGSPRKLATSSEERAVFLILLWNWPCSFAGVLQDTLIVSLLG